MSCWGTMRCEYCGEEFSVEVYNMDEPYNFWAGKEICTECRMKKIREMRLRNEDRIEVYR